MERPKRGLSAFDDIERLDQLGEVGKRPRHAGVASKYRCGFFASSAGVCGECPACRLRAEGYRRYRAGGSMSESSAGGACIGAQGLSPSTKNN